MESSSDWSPTSRVRNTRLTVRSRDTASQEHGVTRTPIVEGAMTANQTGKSLATANGIDIRRIENGKIVEM